MLKHLVSLVPLAIVASNTHAFGQGVAPAPVSAVPAATARTNVSAPAATASAGASTPAASAATVSRATAPTAPPRSPITNAPNAIPALPPAEIAAAPPSLSFADIWNGDPPARKYFTIDRAPRGGPVSATMVGSAPFRIVEMRVYGLPPKGPATSASLALPGNQASALGGGPQARPTSRSLYANQVLKSTVASGPFSTAVDEGDRVVLTIEFAPKWSLDDVAGPKSARVDVTGVQWKTKVPLTGFFDGLKLGLAVARPPTFYAADQPYVPGNRFPAYSQTPQLSVVNATGQPQLVQLTADQLPAGVLVASQQVQFAAGDSRPIPLVVTWDPRSDPTGDVRLRIAYGSSTSFAMMHVEHVPFNRSFRASGSGWSGQVTVSSNGEVRYDSQCFITGMQLVHDCTHYFYCNGQLETDTVSTARALGGPANDHKSWVNHTGLKPDEVFDRMQSTWAVVEFDSSQGDPNTFPRIPLVLQP